MVISLHLPLVLVDDDDLVRVSEENPGYQFEREDDGTLTVSPNDTIGGGRSGKAYAVAIDPVTREVVERGVAPAGLTLHFDAIIDA